MASSRKSSQMSMMMGDGDAKSGTMRKSKVKIADLIANARSEAGDQDFQKSMKLMKSFSKSERKGLAHDLSSPSQRSPD